ncbi:Chorion peroxidase [Portunus trituberculatus]|uniref:Chorion peroxidase n=1 Tax=Portunus trituberculatus TaxID=210409 RepID=A0A5B7D3K7_PORTR|nr:Chorion peroxidase [Portunus trituberculatus]
MAGRVSAMWGAGVCLFMVVSERRGSGGVYRIIANGFKPYLSLPAPSQGYKATSSVLEYGVTVRCSPPGHVGAHGGAAESLSKRHFGHSASTTSPYWGDPEGRRPNTIPNMTSTNLHAPPRECSAFLQPCDPSDRYRTLTGHSAVKSRECGDCEAWTNPICLPIPIPPDDPFIPPTYAETGKRRCLPVVYGSDPCREKELRTRTGGLLRESHHALPPLVNASRFVEANEHLGLVVLHVVYFREHNRIARSLASINPHWNDERIFQVTAGSSYHLLSFVRLHRSCT